ncbi:hypothetical protein QEN19_002755 [Hanseniaspora menglaensis]
MSFSYFENKTNVACMKGLNSTASVDNDLRITDISVARSHKKLAKDKNSNTPTTTTKMSELENHALDGVEDTLKNVTNDQVTNVNGEDSNAFLNRNDDADEDDDLDAVSAANNVIDSIGKDSVSAASSAPFATKTPDRRKIAIKFIQNKTKRHVTFSKRKHGIMKKAYELSVLTGTQVLLLVVSETGLVYTFTTPKFQPIVTEPEGKNLIQTCLNTPDGEEEEEEEEDDEDDEGNNNDNNNNGGAEEEGEEEEEGDDADKNGNSQEPHQQYGDNSNNQYHHPSNIASSDQFNANIVDELALADSVDPHQNKRLKLNDGSFQNHSSNAESLIA